jgi:carnosine N-methyltransferase
MNDNINDEERTHHRNVFNSYRQYATFHTAREIGIDKRRRQLILQQSSVASTSSIDESILPSSHRPTNTSEYKNRQKLLHDAAIRNQYFLDCALRHSGQETSQDVLRRRRNRHQKDGGNGDDSHNDSHEGVSKDEGWVTEEQISKVDSVLKSLARDWSADGKVERSVAYDRIINAIESYYANYITKSYRNCPDYIHRRADVRIAVPGSGLGRLAWELYSRGYTVEGSDFSLPMLVASDFILNGRCGVRSDGENDVTTTTTQLQFAISPWLAETKNVLSIENRVRSVIVPDIDPGIVLLQSPKEQHDEEEEAEFTMLAGEFLHLYSHLVPDQQQRQQTQPNDNNNDNNKHSSPHQQCQKRFHVVACSYFLDTAPTLPHYLQTIYHMLEIGGLLVHFGPLMYHWSGHGNLLPGDEDVVVDTNVGITAGVGEHDYTSSNIQQIKSSYNTRNDRLDSRYLISIDYTWDEVHEMLTNIGFEIIVEERNIPARYTGDACSMMHVLYDCVFCVARRIR